MKRWTLLSCTGAALVGVACSSVELVDAGTPPGDGGVSDGGYDAGGLGDGGYEGLALMDACATLNQARCAYFQRCGLISDAGGSADCVAFLDATDCDPSLWPARVLAGTLRYDGLAAQACVADYASADCAAFQTEPPDCASYLAPAVPLGGECYGPPEEECLQGVCRGAACPYHCQPLGQPGEPCEQDGDCAVDAGLYCQSGSSAGAVSQCAAPAPVTAPCSGTVLCAPGLYCDGTFCTALRSVGQACVPGNCVTGAWCDVALPDAGHCAWGYDAGVPCGTSAQCGEDAVCLTQTHLCAASGPLAAGATCFPEQVCPLGLTCVGAVGPLAGQCAAPVTQGGACVSTLDCEADLACAQSSNGEVCSVRLPDGLTCEEDRDCWWGSACVGGLCARLPRPGEACSPPPLCWYGECSSSDAGASCTGLAGVGTPCTRELDCASERCDGSCLPICAPAG